MRKNTKKVDIIIIAVIILLIAGGILLNVLPKPEQQEDSSIPAAKEAAVSDYNGKRIGVLSGTNYDAVTQEYFPDSECLYYSGYPDLCAALLSGKIDGFLGDEPVLKSIHNEQPEIDYIKDKVTDNQYSFAFRKNDEAEARLCAQVNEFLSKLRDNGTLEELELIWYGSDESKKTVDMSGLDGKNGTIHVITTSTDAPFSYIKDGKNVGYDIDVVVRFCREYGYALDLGDADFAARIPAVESGKYDFTTAMNVTEERKEQVLFSDKVSGGGIALAVRTSDIASPDGAVTEKTPLSYFADKKIGILTGSSYEPTALKIFPDAEYAYYDVSSDLALATVTGKIDGYLMSEDQARTMIAENPTLFRLNEPAEVTQYAFAFPKTEKGAALRDKFNGFIAKIKADGTMDALLEKWTKGDIEKSVDLTGFTGENGTLDIACDGTAPPWEFTYSGEITGYEVELVSLFCREYGYKPEFDTMTFSAVIPGIASEKYDMAAANISVTPERAESVYFSDKESESAVVFVTTSDNLTGAETTLVPAVTLEELNSPERSVGVWTGAAGMLAVERYLPDAKELMFDSISTACEAVRIGQADAFVFERQQLQIALENGISGVMLLDENLGETIDVAVGLSRATSINGLEDSINRFIAEKKADGTLDDMFRRWVFDKNYTMPEIEPAASPKLTLVVGTSGLVEPYSFYEGSTLTGYDIEMARRFAAWLGADIEFKVIDYSGIIAAAQSGSIDCIFANLNVTDERKEAIDFSDPIYSIENGILVRAVSVQEQGSEQSWLDSIALSFEKNFIREDRWQMIVEGIGTTCFITVMSALFGSVLAFLVCMFRRTGSKLANGISNIYVKLLQGTPIVVLLMILYYVILGKTFSSVWVAIIGFTLNFGAYASEIMRSGIESIDGGQREAALALGYSENQAFFKFIFPQAAVRFLPVYRGEIVSLLKSTSIVGYIAIQDLTKMSDIIRSRTYEAFFPLIATAIIYFILAWMISILLKIILRAIDKRRRKGVAAK